MRLSGLSTPALILDVNLLKENAQTMDRILEGTGLKLRPHYKSHKCAAIAKWQVSNGAVGMTCAKLSEAEDLCDSGIDDILIANQITDPVKIRRVADLAGNCRLTICVDNKENVRALSEVAQASGTTIHCLVEYEIGMKRCGVTTTEEVLALAQEILASDGLVFDGIQAYAGHVSHVQELAVRQAMTAENHDRLKELLAFLEQSGIRVKTVSGGSTGTTEIKAMSGLYTELQAGSYLFMDATYRLLDLPFRNSLFLLTTVVSSREDVTVLDAGVKTCGVDQGMPQLVEGTADAIGASEEHFQVYGWDRTVSPAQRVRLIPGHCCTTVNLHDNIYLVDGDRVVDRIPITARRIGR